MSAGRVKRIAGPIIHATGLGNAGLFDVVDVGPKKIIGEVVRLEKDEAVIQVYEDDTGLQVGAAVESTGRSLSARLGPGLIGAIYDGIQRPLELLYQQSGAFMDPGVRGERIDPNKQWNFVPNHEIAEKLRKKEPVAVKPGLLLGSVQETESITCKIMIPPVCKGGLLLELKESGAYTINDAIALSDKEEVFFLAHWWPVRAPRPSARRLAADKPLVTGERAIDVFFPLSKGGAAAIPGGFGTGKTMTQHAIAKWCDADIIIYIGCGERGNEMTGVLTEFPHLIDPRTGRSLMERTILIANTSNMPVAAREVSIYTGVTMAEFYRDMGCHVAIMADSTSRWAEALRELSGRMEEMPAEEGFPAYLPTRLAEFYERAGRVETLNGEEGSISIIGAVSPPGGDFSEPVTQHTRRFTRCFWALDRDLANARHYPAIGWLDSYSEYAEEVKLWWEQVNPAWAVVRQKALDLLKKEQRLSEIVRLIGPDALPDDQRLILVVAEIIKNGFLQQNSFDEIDMYCSPAKQVRLLELMMNFYEKAAVCIKLGAPLVQITTLSERERLSRLKSEIKNTDTASLDDFEFEMNKMMEELERSYRTKEHL
ncbi:MAG: V-type ATP synthase subunit A [Treponema sp.]|jgi:V/A-type H+-transporting ATPase subunit A|nr:V-type ATP synthase subunit A [Treponema sp.]